jgi:quinol monooxygenase YgiN
LSFETTVRIVVDPGQRADTLVGLRSFAGRLTLRSGFLGYDLMEDLDEPGAFLLVERWSSILALQRHLQSDDFRELLAVMDLARQPPAFEIRKVEPANGVHLLALIRGMEGLGFNASVDDGGGG